MRIFIQASDYKLWSSIVSGPHTPTRIVNNVTIPKLESEWDETDERMAQLNAKAMNLLYCALDAQEFNRISFCISAKEIWDKLKGFHEGDVKVKEAKLQVYRSEYEALRMSSTENFQSYMNKVFNVVNSIRSLGEDLPEVVVVKKIVRSLPQYTNQRFQCWKIEI